MSSRIAAFDDEIRRISCWELEKQAAYRKERALSSSNLKSLAYDPGGKKLKVSFHGSGTYEYTGVPSSVPRKIVRAKSAGKAFHRLVIKAGLYPHEKIAEVISKLQPHQQRVVDKIQQPDQPGLVVAHGLGSGKTLTSIAAQEALGLDADVVTPAALRTNYAKEVAKHTKGTKLNRNLQSLQGVASRRESPANPLMIVDEAHRIREMGTKTNQVIRGNTAQKRLLLTASPFYNHPADIAPLINVAAGQNVMPGDRAEFSKRYIHERKISPGFWGRVRGVAPGTVEELNPKKAPEVRQHFGKWVDYHATKKDDPNFPAVERADIKVPMSRQQLKFYDTALDKAPFWVSYKIKKGLPPSKQEAKQLNAFMGAARQISNTTAAYQTKGVAEDPKIGTAFGNLKTNLDASPTSKAVVYSNYLGSGLEPYKKRLTDAKIPFAEFTGGMSKTERDEVMRRYNSGEVRTLLISSAGGEGLDLKGTRLVQVLDPHFNQAKIDQVEGRAIRFGSHKHLPPEERKVRVERYLATRPRSGIMERLRLKKPGQGADEYMATMSANKERLIGSFRKVLEEQSMPKTAFVNAFTDELEKTAVSMEWIVRRVMAGAKKAEPARVDKFLKGTASRFQSAIADAEKLPKNSLNVLSPGWKKGDAVMSDSADRLLRRGLSSMVGYEAAMKGSGRSSLRAQFSKNTDRLVAKAMDNGFPFHAMKQAMQKEAMIRTTREVTERPSKARSLNSPPSLRIGPVRDEFSVAGNAGDADRDPREMRAGEEKRTRPRPQPPVKAKGKNKAKTQKSVKTEAESKVYNITINTKGGEFFKFGAASAARGLCKAAGVAKRQATFDGLRLKIEYDPGDIRKGVDKQTGEPWKKEMKASYGYIPGTKGVDGEAVDVYLPPDAKPDAPVHVVRQVKDDGSHDEDKVMLGCHDASYAKACYEKHTPSKFFGGMKTMSMDKFKTSYLGQGQEEISA